MICQNVLWCFLSKFSTILESKSSHVLAPPTDIREVPDTYVDRHTDYAGTLFVRILQSPHKNSLVCFKLRHIHFLLRPFNSLFRIVHSFDVILSGLLTTLSATFSFCSDQYIHPKEFRDAQHTLLQRGLILTHFSGHHQNSWKKLYKLSINIE